MVRVSLLRWSRRQAMCTRGVVVCLKNYLKRNFVKLDHFWERTNQRAILLLLSLYNSRKKVFALKKHTRLNPFFSLAHSEKESALLSYVFFSFDIVRARLENHFSFFSVKLLWYASSTTGVLCAIYRDTTVKKKISGHTHKTLSPRFVFSYRYPSLDPHLYNNVGSHSIGND